MKRWLSVLAVFCLFIPGLSHGRNLELKDRAGEYDVEIRLSRNPPVIGKNLIEVQIKDPSGQAIKVTGVVINYYMPPMPRMAPMNYVIQAEADRTKYRATLNFVMAGPWVIAVKISAAGKTRTAKFHLDVP